MENDIDLDWNGFFWRARISNYLDSLPARHQTVVEITKEQFQKYEEVRESGRTSMFNIKNVERLSGLARGTIIRIQDNYPFLQSKWGNRREVDRSISG